ncbi:unnamed protein product [Durusdinium trenchii]|uniref:GPI inositol-deacylase n=2 Tax=Durusdinium trenchii TaxID=1381693 RepID=A0ABP0NHG9_9DINO
MQELRKDKPFAVILPGFLGSSEDFEDLARDLRRAGYGAAVAPISWWHWIPCVGGRSMRPILERIDFAVNQVLEDLNTTSISPPSYTLQDFLVDFLTNPGGILKVGGTDDPADYPALTPRGDDFASPASPGSGRRVALVAHSAAGWISRVYLSGVNYGGRSFKGSKKVHSLVCLGSPHFVAENLVFKSLQYLEREEGSALPARVRCLCVGAKGAVLSKASDMTRGAYELCGAMPGDDDVDGDGMTPLFSAIALDSADKMVLENVSHAPVYPAFGPSAKLAEERLTKPWYGSPEILKKWFPWLKASTMD